MPYPIQPPPENAYQITGKALQQGASVFDNLQSMIEKRRQAEIARREAEIKSAREAELRVREDEKYKREQEAIKNELEFRKLASQGKQAQGPATEEGVTPTVDYSMDELRRLGFEKGVVPVKDYLGIGSSAVSRMQKFPGKDGFMKTFDPITGQAANLLDENGQPVPVQEHYRYVESTGGYVPLSTTQPPTQNVQPSSIPQPVKGVIPAGKPQRDLQVIKLQDQIEEIKRAEERAKKGGQYKSSQYQAASYGSRMTVSDKITDDLINDQDFDPTKMRYAVLNKAPNILQSPKLQKLAQAQRDFINAKLRDESGAAIAPSEFESAYIQYFPQVGDGPEVIAQKSQNRKLVTAAMKVEAGGAWDELQDQLRSQKKESGLTPEQRRKQMIIFVNQNPDDPRSEVIRKKLGL